MQIITTHKGADFDAATGLPRRPGAVAVFGESDVEALRSRLDGVDFEVDGDALKIAKIYEGAAWDSDARSPLRTASGEVGEGDYLLAVNGVDVDVSVESVEHHAHAGGRRERVFRPL